MVLQIKDGAFIQIINTPELKRKIFSTVRVGVPKWIDQQKLYFSPIQFSRDIVHFIGYKCVVTGLVTAKIVARILS